MCKQSCSFFLWIARCWFNEDQQKDVCGSLPPFKMVGKCQGEQCVEQMRWSHFSKTVWIGSICSRVCLTCDSLSFPPYLVLLPNQISSPSTKSSIQALILWPGQSEKQCACRHILIIHMMIGGSLLLNHNYWSTAVEVHGWGNMACQLLTE